MIALNVEHPLHALGIGERRRIEQEQIEWRRAVGGPLRCLAQPPEAIGALESMLRAIQAVELEVLRRPVQVAVRKVDAECAARPAAGRVDRGARRVTDQSQKARTARAL